MALIATIKRTVIVDATLLLYALIAGGLVFWLRSILGTRSGEERERPNPFTTPAAEQSQKPRDATDEAALQGDVVTLPLTDGRADLPRNASVTGARTEQVLAEIARADRTFDLPKFCVNAQEAFIMIVEAFADGDREMLKELLEPQVYKAFEATITERDARGEKLSTEIHAVRKVEILDAAFDGRQAFVTIRFIADETCVIRDADNVVLSGDPDRITEMNDIWTFTRLVKNREPVWLLHETRDGDVVEQHKTPVPDSSI